MSYTLSKEQLDLLQYAEDARNFSEYIYNPNTSVPPTGWEDKFTYDNNTTRILYLSDNKILERSSFNQIELKNNRIRMFKTTKDWFLMDFNILVKLFTVKYSLKIKICLNYLQLVLKLSERLHLQIRKTFVIRSFL